MASRKSSKAPSNSSVLVFLASSLLSLLQMIWTAWPTRILRGRASGSRADFGSLFMFWSQWLGGRYLWHGSRGGRYIFALT